MMAVCPFWKFQQMFVSLRETTKSWWFGINMNVFIIIIIIFFTEYATGI